MTATASIGGLIDAVAKFGESGHHLDEMSRRTGFAADYIDELTGSARSFGTTAEDVEQGVQAFARSLQNLHTVSGGELYAGLSRSGLENVGRQMKATQNDPRLSEAIKAQRNYELMIETLHREMQTPDGEPRARALASQAFGPGADSAINIARQDKAHRDAAMARAGQLRGSAPDPEQAEKYERALNDAANAVVGIQRAFADKVLPEITNLANKTTEWLASLDRDDIGKGVLKFADELKEKFSEILSVVHFIEKFNAATAGSPAQASATWIREHGGQQVGDALKSVGPAVNRGLAGVHDFVTAPGGRDPLGPQQKPGEIPNIGDMLKPIKPPQYAVGAEEITRPGLAFVHEGESIVPAESNGPFKSAGSGGSSAFQQAHSEENRRTVDENTAQVKVLNEKLQKLIDGDTADRDGWRWCIRRRWWAWCGRHWGR